MTAPTADDMLRDMKAILETAAKFKKVMLKRGINRARTTCPKCGGILHGRLNPRGNRPPHIHMACENADCTYRMME
jgi:hypothetical protein